MLEKYLTVKEKVEVEQAPTFRPYLPNEDISLLLKVSSYNVWTLPHNEICKITVEASRVFNQAWALELYWTGCFHNNVVRIHNAASLCPQVNDVKDDGKVDVWKYAQQQRYQQQITVTHQTVASKLFESLINLAQSLNLTGIFEQIPEVASCFVWLAATI